GAAAAPSARVRRTGSARDRGVRAIDDVADRKGRGVACPGAGRDRPGQVDRGFGGAGVPKLVRDGTAVSEHLLRRLVVVVGVTGGVANPAGVLQRDLRGVKVDAQRAAIGGGRDGLCVATDAVLFDPDAHALSSGQGLLAAATRANIANVADVSVRLWLVRGLVMREHDVCAGAVCQADGDGASRRSRRVLLEVVGGAVEVDEV